MTPAARPRLRAVEIVVVPDERHGRALMLRDTDGITSAVARVPAPLIPIVARFDGSRTVQQIAGEVSGDSAYEDPLGTVLALARELDRALFLDTPRYRAARRVVEAEFRAAEVRPASHAGGAYHADPVELASYLDRDCLAKASVAPRGAPIRALVAPHIDPWRGALGYGHAYGALAADLPPEADTFVLLGTSHAPMSEPFALCRKAFATPLGPVLPDQVAIDEVAARAPFDAYADELNHKREHSLELQAVFVRHVTRGRPVRIVPVLCGLGDSQSTGRDPSSDARAEGFLSALADVVDGKGGRVVVIAGADLAHVGPRFGDLAPYDATSRARLAKEDEESLALATERRPREFFRHVQKDLDTRRVCGLGPIYTLLRLLPVGVAGEVLHYEQTIDPDEGSIVSHAAVAFYG